MSQTGTTTITVNKERNEFTVSPITQLYKWRQLQVEHDSLSKRVVILEKIDKQKDEVIKENEKDNKQLRQTVAQTQPAIDKANFERDKAKNQNKGLKIGLGVAVLAAIAQTIALIVK